ncbi:MAG: GAF domain-containing sensor histidine kinase [Candidatus Saccharimonadales bacterium]
MEKPKLRRTVSKRKQLEQDLAHVSKEMYKRNLDLASTNRTLSLLRRIDALVLESHDSIEFSCGQISKAIVDNSEYPWVSIFGKPSGHDRLDMYGWFGSNSNIMQKSSEAVMPAYLSLANKWLKGNRTTLTLRLWHTSERELASFLHCRPEFVADLRDNQKINLVYFIKLMARGTLVGVMGIGFPANIETLSEDNEQMLKRISEAVGVALDNRLLYEENQRVVKQLQTTNAKLRALDETKDEFISMASHQLRTPLTTVKGYVSMVLEGDAGKISEPQRKLLDQSFLSAQRMVYLIADLLNVSRLRTGKFVIDAVPTNLADVVEGEIQQLIETAKARNLELTYDKPKTFPTLMLDETKIRQVIMNFADNAIYYTPSGGHIKVGLAETPDSIEFTVVDDGIGVPKAVQHHLFTKFYRADNAKEARPDGTGLGLFMAQKVIVAQGGAIVFRSEEGKGSTFGFSFSKARLKVPPHRKPAAKSGLPIIKATSKSADKAAAAAKTPSLL